MERRLQRDLMATRDILRDFVAHHQHPAGGAAHGHKRSSSLGGFAPGGVVDASGGTASGSNSSRRAHASDFVDLTPESVSLSRRGSQHGTRGPSPTRPPRISRCIYAGCSQEPVGGRGFCAAHAQGGGLRVIVRGGGGGGGGGGSRSEAASRAMSPTRAMRGPIPPPASPGLFPPIPVSPIASPSHTRAQLAAAQASAAAREREAPIAEADDGPISHSGSASPAPHASPVRLSSSVRVGANVTPDGDRILTPRNLVGGGGSRRPSHKGSKALHPAPPGANGTAATNTGTGSSSQPMRALRTPAGLALSYEHGRATTGSLRKEVIHKAPPPSQPIQTSGVDNNAAAMTLTTTLGGHMLLSHLHQTPLQPLRPPSASPAGPASTASSAPPPPATVVSQLSFTESLNRVAAPPSVAAPVAVSSPNVHSRTLVPSPTSSQPGNVANGGAASTTNGTLASPSKVSASPDVVSALSSAAAAGDRSLSAVQRQRAHRAALLSKALSKPTSVQSLTRARVDALGRLLNHRPSKMSLLQRRIVRAEEEETVRLAVALERRASLAHLLQARPSASVLAHKNILRDALSEETRAESRRRIDAFILKRPSVIEVEARFAAQKEDLLDSAIIEDEDDLTPATRNEVQTPTVHEEEEEKEEGGDDSTNTSTTTDGGSPLSARSFKKFPGVLKDASSTTPRRPSRLAAGGRKFSIFTSAGLASSGGGMALDRLSNFFETRPHFEDLLKRNIMMTRPGTNFHQNPTLAANQRRMSFTLLSNNVSKLLQARPTMHDLRVMAKNLLGDLVQTQMDSVREDDDNETKRAEVDLAAQDASGRNGGGVGISTGTGTSAGGGTLSTPSISLESLASGTLRIDEILSQKRRIAEHKLRMRAREEEVPGGLYMFGANERGQTGFMGDVEFVPRPTALTPLLRETIVQVACGFEHTLVRTLAGRVFTFGKNSYGQLGLGTADHVDTQDRDQPYAVGFRGSPLWQKTCTWIAAYEKTSAILTQEDGVYTMGDVVGGSLGHGDPNTSDPAAQIVSTPTLIAELRDKSIHRVSLGGSHGAALDAHGELYTWGRNEYGALGDGTFNDKLRPTPVPTYGEFWSDVVCGESHTGAIGFDNNVYMFGSNRYDEIPRTHMHTTRHTRHPRSSFCL